NIMPASIECAKAGVTTGEWGAALREIFGEYRAPTGVAGAAAHPGDGLDRVRAEVERVSRKLGRRIKFLVGKPGLDGHSNGAEQIAVRARDAGMEVVYEGIRLTPAEIVNAALESPRFDTQLNQDGCFYGPHIYGAQHTKPTPQPLFRRSHDLSRQCLSGLIAQANESVSRKHAFDIRGQRNNLYSIQVYISG